ILLAVVLIGITAGRQALAPLIFATAVDGFADPDSSPAILPITLLMGYALVFTLSRILQELRYGAVFPIVNGVNGKLRQIIFRHMHTLGLQFHLSRTIGQLSEVIGRGIGSSSTIIMNPLMTIFPLMVQVTIVASVLLTQFQAVYALVILVTFIAYGIVLVIGAEIHGVRQRKAMSEIGAISGRAWDALFNYETIKYFGAEQRADRELAKVLRAWEAYSARASYVRSLTGVLTVLVLGTGITLLLWMAGQQMLAGEITIGGLVLINAYLLQIIIPLEAMAQLYRDTKLALINMEKLMELMEEVPDMVDAPDAQPLPDGGGEISVRNLSFEYDPRRPVLKGLSFDVPSGSTTALVGPSGAGKSTVARLLFRFYDPTGGSIHMEGQDIRGLKVDTVRAAIGVVPQDTVLFNDTLRHNIGIALDDATAEDVERAARAAHLHDFITGLPEGYDTVVGERGLKLSGGEKQRVAIARIVLKNPRIFLFDEATSSLDSITEGVIQENLAEISHGATTLIIAHRLSTVVHADQILVIEDGEITERGTHQSLLTAMGSYAALWTKQQKEKGQSAPAS
ncbi:MAG: ABC transporter ATP-binding protein/permease, partial [Alphaproteobacteria bacterium]|nr:ABC transporter ATP-binding protein/permease [Alphaproteobacteria bacterium]